MPRVRQARRVPLHLALDLPYLPITNLDQWQAVQEAYYAWEPVKKELARFNGVSLFAALLPQYEFMGTGKAPKTLADWKGMRVRALGPLGDAMRTLGAVPTSVPAPEVYTGLERDTFQAASFPFTYSFTAYKLHEVSKWYTLGMQLGVVHNSLMFSQTAWKALPDEYKKILQDAKPEAYRLQREAYEEADKKSFPMFEKRKLEVIKVTPEMRAKLIATAAQPVWDHWVADTEKKGLPGKEALERVLSLAKKHATN